MALVLRKAALPKNLSLLKCIKGRPIATATNRTNATAITKAVPFRRMKNPKTVLMKGYKIVKAKPLSIVKSHSARSKIRIPYCMSCPSFGTATRVQVICASSNSAPCCSSSPRTGTMAQKTNYSTLTASPRCTLPFPAPISARHSFGALNVSKILQTPDVIQGARRGYSCCACPNCCLPPPCNTPAKCIQYMTGYYYYPYGFWFCGPYHVTGTCTPVGPACPGGPCGPCPPCPKCVCSCPCPKCCACLSPAVSAAVGSPLLAQKPEATTACSFAQPLPDPGLVPPEQLQASHVANPFQHAQPLPPFPVAQPLPPYQQMRPTGPTPPPIKMDSTQNPALQFRPVSPPNQSVIHPKPPTSQSVISKFFQSGGSSKSKGKSIETITKCLVCPGISNLESHTIDPFPKYPKKHISGSYSRSFTYYKDKKASLKSKSSEAAK